MSTSPTRIDYTPEPPKPLLVGDVFEVRNRRTRATYQVRALSVDDRMYEGQLIVVSGEGFGSARFEVRHVQRPGDGRMILSTPDLGWSIKFIRRPVDKPENS